MKVKPLPKIVLDKFSFYKWQALDGNTFGKDGVKVAVFESKNTKQFHLDLFTKDVVSVRLVSLSVLLDVIEGNK